MLAGLVNLNGGPIVSDTVCWLRLVYLNGRPIVSKTVCWLGL